MRSNFRTSLSLALAALILGACGLFASSPARADDNGLLAVKICGPTTATGTQCLIPNNDGTFSVSGSFSLSGFTPNGNSASLSVTTSSASVALPSGAVVAVANTGANDASFKLSVGAGTAATTDFILKAGATIGLTPGSNTFINAITGSSTTTLRITGGSGLVTGFGGGSSGGGGAITAASGAFASGSIASGAVASGAIASGAVASGALAAGAGTDGWDSTQGAKADGVCGSATGTCSIAALIKFLNNAAIASIPAGTNRIGYASDDPCAQATKSTAHFSSTSSGGNLITGTTAKITYICGYSVVTSAASHVSLCEATGTACSGGTPAAVFGNTGTTAANGKSYAANGGETFGNGGYTIAKTATTGQNVDVLFDTGNSPQVNVDVSYVIQ